MGVVVPPAHALLITLVLATAARAEQPFTSEHSARGVVYNMAFAPPISAPQDGYGLAVADLEGDGDLDLVLLGRPDGLVGIFENDGSGGFINRSVASGIAATPSGAGVVAFDYDRDGDLDLFLAQRHHPSRLWRNEGALQFVDASAAAGFGATLPATGCSAADFDGDGWIDLHVCTYLAGDPNRLFRNRGDGTFEDVAPALGVASPALSYQSVWSDYDRDGWPDLCVSNDRGVANVPNQLWRNLGGSFADVSASTGLDVALCSMGVACGDLDRDGRPDFYFTNLPDDVPPLHGANPLLLSSAEGAFSEAHAAWGVAHFRMSWAASFWDFDNDADLDLYVNNEFQPNTLYRQHAAPPMTDVAPAFGVTGTANLSFASAIGDLDRDGDLDLVQNNYGGPVRLYMNHAADAPGAPRWLRLRIAGDGRVRDAIGASATLVAAPRKGRVPPPAQWREVLCGGNGYLGQHELTLHFGLGASVAAQSIEVRWPAGGPTRILSNVPAGFEWTAYPPGRLGDADGDGRVALADWSVLAAGGAGAVTPGREAFDFDGDWTIGADDVAAFWARCSTPRGDFDGDGLVAAADVATVLAAWGSPGGLADLDLDGFVGPLDLAAVLAAWSTG